MTAPAPAPAVPRAHTLWALVVATLLLGAVLSPLARDPGLARHDGYPLSTYPMFARRREGLQTVHHVVIVHADGTRAPAPPSLLGTSEPMQAVSLIRRHTRTPAAAAALCQRVAARLLRDDDDRARDTVTVEVRSDTYDPRAYLGGDRAPRATTLHATCPVVRSAP